MKKRTLSFVVAMLLTLSLLPVSAFAEAEAPFFEDVTADAWYYSAVQSAVKGGLMTGISETSFAPEETVTRAMLVTILYRLEGSPKTGNTIGFTDVSSSSWYFDAIKWAAANGIASGYSSSTFGAEDNITRQQMAAMLQRCAKYKGRRIDATADLSAYSDAPLVADWARDGMNWAVFSGLITGTDKNSLSPDGFATRAQAAVVLQRYISGVNFEKRTSNYITEFVKGSFDNFYNDSSDSLRKAITKEQLSEGWKKWYTAISSSGEYLGGIYAKDDFVSGFVSGIQYNLKVTIHYDSAGKPDGIRTTVVPKDTPKPQATQQWEEVPVTVGEAKLPGMLTIPKGVAKPPVVILVQGSGATDMNESYGPVPNSPFQDIAHGLASQGVATLRYNKRTYQYPISPCDSIEYETLDDASAAAKLLASDSRVDGNRIFMLGHSLGGMMAPKITADNPKIKGFISMAGTLRPMQEVILSQFKLYIQTETSLTEQQKKEALAEEEALLEKTRTLNDGGTGTIMGISTKWWASLNSIDSVAIVKNLKVPILVLQGSADFQVFADEDYKLWQETLTGRTNVDFKLYDGLSHMFMPNQLPANGGIDTSVYMHANHIDSKVINDIASWVLKQQDSDKD